MASLKYIQSSTLQSVTLGSAYTAGSGTMTLTAGNGAYLPSSGDFWLSYNNGAGTIRLFKVTARATDTLTVTAVSGEGSGDGNISSGETLRWALTYDALTQLRADIVAQAGIALLSTQTASSSASLNFTSIITSAYSTYMIVVSNLLPATNGVSFNFRVSTNNGSSYVSTSSYGWSTFRFNGGGSVPTGSGSATEIQLNTAQSNSTTSQGFSGTFYLSSPLSSTRYKTLYGNGSGDSGTFDGFVTYGGYNATTAVDAFQIYASSGNIASGTVSVYGLVG